MEVLKYMVLLGLLTYPQDIIIILIKYNIRKRSRP